MTTSSKVPAGGSSGRKPSRRAACSGCVADAGQVRTDDLTRHALAHDASHYLLRPRRSSPHAMPTRWPGCCAPPPPPGCR